MRRALLLPAMLAAALACNESPTASTPPPLASTRPAFSYGNGPAALPNLFRYSDPFAIGMMDVEADLVAIAGLPDDVYNIAVCGGTDPFQDATFQDVGTLRDVVHRLVVRDHVNLHVFLVSTFVYCVSSTEVARGTGKVVYTNNDVFGTGNGGNSWGIRIEGDVTLSGGGEAFLHAQAQMLAGPDGAPQFVHTKVSLVNR